MNPLIKINKIQREYIVKTGKDMTISEISTKLKISKEEVAMCIDALNPVESIYKEDTNDDKGRYLIDKIASNQDEQNNITNRITLQEMIKRLNKREKEVIMLRYYKEKTQSQVGKILGISQVQVSRIEKKVLQKMRNKWEAV